MASMKQFSITSFSYRLLSINLFLDTNLFVEFNISRDAVQGISTVMNCKTNDDIAKNASEFFNCNIDVKTPKNALNGTMKF